MILGQARPWLDSHRPATSDALLCSSLSRARHRAASGIRTLKEAQIEDGRIRLKPSKTQKSSGKAFEIVMTPEIAEVIARAKAIKTRYGIISPYLFPTQKGRPYAQSSLGSMWDRAKERIGMTEDVVFKDLRALAATDAARRSEDKKDIQKRLVHTSAATTEIYIK